MCQGIEKFEEKKFLIYLIKKEKWDVEKPLLFVEDKKVLVFTYFFFHLCPASHEVTHLAQSFRHV